MNENYSDRFFSPGETVWYKGVKCTVLKCHKENKFSVVPQKGPDRNRETIVPAGDLGVYTDLHRIDDEITDLEKELSKIEIQLAKLKNKRTYETDKRGV